MKWHYTKFNDFPVDNSTRERMCICKTKSDNLEALIYNDNDHYWHDPLSKDHF